MTQTEAFEELRSMLFSIAYRILGRVSEAEDAVQETWIRYSESEIEPNSLKSYLSTIVTRISIDILRSAQVRRETYVGPWFPEPLPTDHLHVEPTYDDPERTVELADSVSMAALLLLERLSPLERAVFVLREVFRFSFTEVAAAARILVAGATPLFTISNQLEQCELNGQPGAILRDREGRVIGTWTLEILDGQIHTIRSVSNPDKLTHLGPVADLHAITKERAQAQRRRRQSSTD